MGWRSAAAASACLLAPALAAVSGCAERRSERPLAVEYAGCRSVALPGPVCVPGDDRLLRIWIPGAAGGGLEIDVDGRPAEPEIVEVSSGRRFEIALPEGARRLTARDPIGGVWRLELDERPPWLVELESAWRSGEAAAAERILDEKAHGGLPAERGLALRTLGRVAYGRGNAASGQRLLRQAIRWHRAAGEVLSEVDDACLLVFHAVQDRRFGDARDLLGALDLPAEAPVEARALLAYYRGVLAAAVGDFRSALASFEAAAEDARRLGLARLRRDAEQMLGWQLQALGRSQDAEELYVRLAADPQHETPCERAQLLGNRGWSWILAREAGDPADDPVPLFEEAVRIFATETCGRPIQELNMRLNLALAHLQNGRPGRATAVLEGLGDLAAAATPELRLWQLDVEARVALAQGRIREALDRYAELARLGARAFSPESRWRAAYGRARAQLAAGDAEAALAALAEADALLDQESLRVPVHEGREMFLASREAATRLYLELLLRSGRERQALAVARRSRARVLRSLESGDRLSSLAPEKQRRWDEILARYLTGRAELEAMAGRNALGAAERATLDAELRDLLDQAFALLGQAPGGSDPLPSPRPGELLLAYHPLPEGWVGFAADGETVEARRLEVTRSVRRRPETLAASVLEPFRTAIEDAERIRVLPYGPLRRVDFHALPFGDDVLLAQAPVVYGLDLDAAARPADAVAGRALVVVDPRQDLPAARREAEVVRAALARSPATVTVDELRGPEADAATLRRALDGADLFHFAGHGVYGGRGWESALLLAGSSRLTAGDLLALPRVPARVVLSSCETARTAAESPIEGIALAQAFLVAGARQVIAAVRPVGDRAAEGLFARFYSGWSAEDADLAALLREAQLAWRREATGVDAGDWASFRVLEP